MHTLKTMFVYLLLSFPLFAANLYVDNGAIESGATWSGVDGESYTCAHGTGTGYSTGSAGAAAMSSGDDIYFRTGTYTEADGEYLDFLPAANGTSENWSTVQSYPGEWAIIDGNGSAQTAIGHHSYADTRSDGSLMEYWIFERLEITGGDGSGLFVSGGPVKVRYCYIHDNLAALPCENNPCGLKGKIWIDSIVEYNFFENNGCGPIENELHSVTAMQIHSDYEYSDPEVGPTVAANAMARNEYRYNYIVDTDKRANTGIHQKARQYLTPHTVVDYTYDDWGDKIHHNIIVGPDRGIGILQDFAQVYNNILDPGVLKGTANNGLHVNDNGSDYGVGQTEVYVYNNTVLEGRIMSNFGKGVYVINPIIQWFNNIVSNPCNDYDGRYDYTVGDPYQIISGDPANDYDPTRTHIENNYLYAPGDANEIKITRNSGEGYGAMLMSSFDSYYTHTNYRKASSEGSDNLYTGATGSDQYITRSTHSIGAGKTIADGGYNTAHTYLSGVTIPDYVGATNPDDNDWVAGVMALDATYFTSADIGSVPTWIEGAAESTGDTNISDSGTQVTISATGTTWIIGE